MGGGGAQEEAKALAKWEWGSLSLTAMRPAEIPEGALDVTLVRAPDGEGRTSKDSNAAILIARCASSFPEYRLECDNSNCFHGFGDYCLWAPNLGEKRARSGPTH